ncbi:major tail protein [Beduinella massiliensis]|uniref:major tail protein n=1 Tax=Beduinella massiliensis TaxID=1852363 RepID=UPI0031F91416
MGMTKYRGPVSIGLRDVCYAMITKDDETGTVYETKESTVAVKGVAGAIDATITPSSENTPLYADDGTFAEITSLGDVSIALELASLPDDVQVDWFGHQRDEDGVLVKGADDTARHFALGFKSQNHDKTFKYVWVYKALASLPENAHHTKEGSSVTMQTQKVTISCSPRLSDGKWMASVNSGAEGASADVISKWFEKPYEKATV